MQRGQFSSTFTFVLAAAGSAVGLGNIGGFPTRAAENGGAAFLLMYLVLAFLLAYPALMAELIIGRHTRSNMVNALTSISPKQFSQTDRSIYRSCRYANGEFYFVLLQYCCRLDDGRHDRAPSLK